MIEIPEAYVISNQINEKLIGKKIKNVVVENNPHKMAWYFKDPNKYPEKLLNNTIKKSENYNGVIEIQLNEYKLGFNEGIKLRYFTDEKDMPKKHQLLLQFIDDSFLTASVQMYGGIICFKDEEFDNPYFLGNKEKPNPLNKDFNYKYFESLLSGIQSLKISVKAFLATEQRIPGLGNGVLQDILWNAKIHPKTKLELLTKDEIKILFDSIKSTLKEMADLNGRDTETDLYGEKGKYITAMSKNNKEKRCPRCGGNIIKKQYLGGSVYYCDSCQKEKI